MLSFLEQLLGAIFSFRARVTALIGRIWALIFPSFGKARTSLEGWGRGLRWTIRIVVLAGILVGLWWINVRFDLSPQILAPTKRLRDFFLPILGLLLYILLWLAWWLWRLLGPEEATLDFADIDDAWKEALRALKQTAMDVSDAPLFLVLGRPAGSEEALFSAAQLGLLVKQAPSRAEAPLHVYASRDAIYLTCAGASLLGKQAAILAGDVDPALDGPPAGGLGAGAVGEDIFKTLQPKGRLQDVQAVLARAREQGRSPDQLTEQEKQEIHQLIAQEEVEHKQARPRPQFLKNAEETARLTARLKHLCQLVARDRHPYCPINGVLLLVPFAASDTKEDADQTGTICQLDLATIRRGLQVHCPLFAMVCDLEKAPGFRDFTERFPADQRQRRVGLRLPLAPDLAQGESLPDLIDRSVHWICNSLFPSWIYKLFRVETASREDYAGTVKGNSQLYRLLSQVRERQKRLSSILVRGLVPEQGGPLLLGGCYLAGTGKDPVREQAFIPGIFRRLIENQNYVSWTEEALAEETNYQQWTRYGYVGITVCCACLLIGWAIATFWK